jgi:hypothetical protein
MQNTKDTPDQPDGGGREPDWIDGALAERDAGKARERVKARATRRAKRSPLRNGELSQRQKHHIAVKCLDKAADRYAALPEGVRDEGTGKALLDMGKFVNEGCLSRDEVYRAIVAAAYVNGLDRDVANRGIAKVQKDVDRVLDREHGLTVDWDQFDWEPDDTDIAGGFDHEDTARATPPPLVELEDGFWTQRDSLTDIYFAALARMCSPWAVLAHCVARALTLVRPNATLPPLIGGPGSLNWFAAITAVSGGGKGAAAAVAHELVDDFVRQRNLGSGEGLIDAYVKPKDNDTGEPAGMHESVMFVADEIDTLAALASRVGNTMSSILRSGFSGETLGFSYRSNDRHLQAHTYRMTLVVNVQPVRAGALLDDQYGGMLQRFMWFPGADQRISLDTPPMPIALELPPPLAWAYPQTLKIPDRVETLIRTERVKTMRGQQEHLDGHAVFIREKFAFALALLDGRDQLGEADWDLAGIAMRVSDHTRQWVMAQLVEADEQEATQRGTRQGIASAAAAVSKTQAEWKRAHRIDSWIFRKLKAAGREGITAGTLRRDADSTYRPFIEPRLNALVAQQLVTTVDRREGESTDRWVLKDDGPQ